VIKILPASRVRPLAAGIGRNVLKVVGVVSLAAALAVFVVGPPPESRKPPRQDAEEQQAPTASLFDAPSGPVATTGDGGQTVTSDGGTGPAQSADTLSLPDGFPGTAGPYLLESIKEEHAVEGAESYFAARYTAGAGEAVSVRLVGLSRDHADQFSRAAIQALQTSAVIEAVALPKDLKLPKGASTKLFVRNGAGLFTYAAADRLVLVAAPDPDAALTVGRALLGL